MIRYSEKTYGIKPIILRRPKSIAGKQRYCIVINRFEHIDLNYANPEIAITKAENFARHCYRNFIDFQGNQVVFTFKKV